jgi:hypothetical protein
VAVAAYDDEVGTALLDDRRALRRVAVWPSAFRSAFWRA